MPPKRRRRESVPSNGTVPSNSTNEKPENDHDKSKKFTFILDLNLGEVEGPLAMLSVAQQRRQRSKVFVYCGLHCVLAIERVGKSIGLVLFILSVKFDPEDKQADHQHLCNLIKDSIPSTSDNSRFHASEAQAINLVGKNYPANVVKLCPIEMTLQSGVTKSEKFLEFPDINQEELYRPYYESNWWGFGLDLLEDHTFRPCKDGAAVEIGIQFNGKLRPLGYLD